MALSMLDCGLLPLSQHSMFFHKRISYHGYEGLALNMHIQLVGFDYVRFGWPDT